MEESQEISAFSDMKELEARWKEAFRKQDGYGLLTLLRVAPKLILVQYGGCNVLHLSIRNRWYGLVREVLLNFCPLRTEASKDDSGPTYHFTPEQFWYLVEGKESGAEFLSPDGPEFKYASGFDVLAMAVVQGHGGINTILAEAAQTVGGGYYYNGEVIRWKAGHMAEDIFRAESSPTLIRIIAECLEGESIENYDLETANERAHGAPTVSASATGSQGTPGGSGESIESSDGELIQSSDRERENERAHAAPTVSASATGSHGTPGGSGPNLLLLENKIDPAWKEEWNVTSPFLPFEEFFFLACCFPPLAWRSSSSFHIVRDRVLRSCRASSRSVGSDSIKFRWYLGNISDTWGMAVHHTVHAKEISESVLLLVSGITVDSWDKRDTSGRTAFYIQLALGRLQKPINYLVTPSEKRAWPPSFVNASKDTRNYGRWSFGKGVCEIDVKAVSGRNGYSPHEPFSEGEILGFHSILRSPHLAESRGIGWMTDMLFAAYTGNAAKVQYLANLEDQYDAAKLQNLREPALDDVGGAFPKLLNCSALHIAAAAGHPHVIRAILATGTFDPLIEDWEGNSALHLATHFETPLRFPHSLADFCVIPDRRIGNSYTVEFDGERKELLRMAESRRQGCINLLLQAGIDVWQTNKKQEIADPGPRCSPEYSTWWYERVSKETLAAKSSLTAGANAISVTAALVATASYIGPLQPPLGYAGQSKGMQVAELTVRIFIVCNTLAFYLALAAIMLSLTPSLPMPRESTLDELKLIRRTVTLAVGLLILSIVAVLIAFASASIAVIPNEDSWNHGGLTVSTISVGGFICLLVLILCLFRVVRLAFHRNIFVRRLYRKYVCM